MVKKVAYKVASNYKDKINEQKIALVDWLTESYPEVWREFMAIKQLESAVDDLHPVKRPVKK